MPLAFSPRSNLIVRGVFVGVPLLVAAVVGIGYAYVYSAYGTDVGVAVPQAIPFSHAHHVGADGLDCRYCHASVEYAAFAGMPSTQTCMHCHWQLWTEASVLEPLRESWRTGRPIQWRRVHDLPEFVYFDHSIHISKGVGCATCHGRVDQMPLMRKNETLFMQWCLDCHRHPERHLRPREEVFNMQWQPPADQEEQGRRLMDEYNVRTEGITDCTTCHR